MTGRGVGGEQDLEATIEPKAGGREIGADAAARGVRRLEQQERLAAFVQDFGAGQPRQAGAHNHNHSVIIPLLSVITCTTTRVSPGARAARPHPSLPHNSVF